MSSPPSRGRGSKHGREWPSTFAKGSPPSRGRGSKQQLRSSRRLSRMSPLPGGVDRNSDTTAPAFEVVVAPFPGAWIETMWAAVSPLLRRSPPSRGRGSKPDGGRAWPVDDLVAPFPGAWIETRTPRPDGWKSTRSPPSRGRGSKRDRSAGAGQLRQRRPLPGGVDRNYPTGQPEAIRARRPLPGGVDRNYCVRRGAGIGKSRPLPGGVDRNRAMKAKARGAPQVAPFPGAWIETGRASPSSRTSGGRPLPGGVDRNTGRKHEPRDMLGRPLPGGVDRNQSRAKSPSLVEVSPP